MMIKRRRVTLAEVREELAGYEKHYGVATATLEEAFRRPGGMVAETPEFVRWSMLRTAAGPAASRNGQGMRG